MDTWKLLLGFAGLLVVAAAAVSVLSVDLSPTVLVGGLVVVAMSLGWAVLTYRVVRSRQDAGDD